MNFWLFLGCVWAVATFGFVAVVVPPVGIPALLIVLAGIFAPKPRG